MCWFSGREFEFRDLWLSKSKTAVQMAEHFGTTKGAIIGKAGRLGLSHSGRPRGQPPPRVFSHVPQARASR